MIPVKIHLHVIDLDLEELNQVSIDASMHVKPSKGSILWLAEEQHEDLKKQIDKLDDYLFIQFASNFGFHKDYSNDKGWDEYNRNDFERISTVDAIFVKQTSY